MGTFKSKMRLSNEPKEQLAEVITILENVALNQEILSPEDEPKLCEYFFDDFMGIFSDSLVKHCKTDLKNQGFKDLLPKLPPLLAKILAANATDVDLVDSMKCIFDHKAKLYQHQFLSDENAILKQGSLEEMSKEEKEWRQALEVGSKLDALKIDPEQKVKCWGPATVKSKPSEEKVIVTFENDAALSDR
jgi:hypothetical protein